MFTRSATRWRLLLLFLLAFALSLWWSDTGIERPRGPAFIPPPPPPSLAPERVDVSEDKASKLVTDHQRTGMVAVVPAAAAAPRADSPHQHADGDNAPGIGLEPEPEAAPE